MTTKITEITEIPAPLRGQRLAVVDVEGNGQHPPEIVEIAVLPIGPTRAAAEQRSWLVRPTRAISPVVTRIVHGISNADVAACPAWAEIADQVAGLLADRILVAHHAWVEHRVLTAHLPGWRPPLVLDTLRLAKHVWPRLPRGYSLEELSAHAGLGDRDLDNDLDNAATAGGGEGRPHRAAYDTWCTWRLLHTLTEQSGLDWAGLVQAAALRDIDTHSDSSTANQGGLW